MTPLLPPSAPSFYLSSSLISRSLPLHPPPLVNPLPLRHHHHHRRRCWSLVGQKPPHLTLSCGRDEELLKTGPLAEKVRPPRLKGTSLKAPEPPPSLVHPISSLFYALRLFYFHFPVRFSHLVSLRLFSNGRNGRRRKGVFEFTVSRNGMSVWECS